MKPSGTSHVYYIAGTEGKEYKLSLLQRIGFSTHRTIQLLACMNKSSADFNFGNETAFFSNFICPSQGNSVNTVFSFEIDTSNRYYYYYYYFHIFGMIDASQ